MLSDAEIKSLQSTTDNTLIRPFDAANLKGASYDLSFGSRLFISGQTKEMDLEKSRQELLPNHFAVVTSKESFKFPQKIAANIGPMTKLTKKGILLLAGHQIDPGFEGHLVLGLFNSSPVPFEIVHGDPLCSIQVFRLENEAEREFPPMEDLIKGQIPDIDKTYLRGISPLPSPLSLSNEVAKLKESVKSLQSEVGPLRNLVYGGLLACMET